MQHVSGVAAPPYLSAGQRPTRLSTALARDRRKNRAKMMQCPTREVAQQTVAAQPGKVNITEEIVPEPPGAPAVAMPAAAATRSHPPPRARFQITAFAPPPTAWRRRPPARKRGDPRCARSSSAARRPMGQGQLRRWKDAVHRSPSEGVHGRGRKDATVGAGNAAVKFSRRPNAKTSKAPAFQAYSARAPRVRPH